MAIGTTGVLSEVGTLFADNPSSSVRKKRRVAEFPFVAHSRERFLTQAGRKWGVKEPRDSECRFKANWRYF